MTMTSSRPPSAPQSDRERLARILLLAAAFISFVFSVVLWFTDSRDEALFVGLWVPSILALGAFYFAAPHRS